MLAKGRRFWDYAYLFAKKDRANINPDELASFRKLAALYDAKSGQALATELRLKELVEICNEDRQEV